MLEDIDDDTHQDARAPLRRVRPEYDGLIGERSTFRSSRSSSGTAAFSVNNSVQRPVSDKRLLQAMKRIFNGLRRFGSIPDTF